MFLIPCPWCGERDQHEFRCGGEAHVRRPAGPEADGCDDVRWADYLFMCTNPKGLFHEQWFHAHGCRRWFHAVRDTVTDRILAVYRMDEPPPEVEDGDRGRR